jgi:hypothetical protein
MVHNTALIGRRFMSYDYRKLDRFTKTGVWADYTLRHKSGIWQNFAVTFLKTLNAKISVNKLSFSLVTHTAYSDARFDSRRFLKSGQGAEHLID